mmetsp:Transcript_24373/g.51056  ORF Transcript_24373/g.51056 Transcript_24373/m.51056 type:complete len:211 (-) Transcript_24373:65-697(-)
MPSRIIILRRDRWPRRQRWRIGRMFRRLPWRRFCLCTSVTGGAWPPRKSMPVEREERACSRANPSWIRPNAIASATPRKNPAAKPVDKNSPTKNSFPNSNPAWVSITPTKSENCARSFKWHVPAVKWWSPARIRLGKMMGRWGRNIIRVPSSFGRCRRMSRAWCMLVKVTMGLVGKDGGGRGERDWMVVKGRVFTDCRCGHSSLWKGTQA